MKRKIVLIVICIVAALAVWHFSLRLVSDPAITVQSPTTAPTQTITIGWAGDMVPATDPAYDLTSMDSVSPVLQQQDLMIGNLEGTLTHNTSDSKCNYIAPPCYVFAGDTSFADTLKAAGFDFISLMNNHSLDYGTQGLNDTEAELTRVGLPYIAPNKPTTSIIVKGVKIGIMGVSSTEPGSDITDYVYIAQTVQYLKQHNDIVIVIFHGGAEGIDKTVVTNTEEFVGSEDRGNVQAVAYTAINAGADIVLGDGPHVLRKVEWYHSKPIAYSLGNFVGGDGRLATKGTLGLGGIYTVTFQNDPSGKEIPTTDNFTSVTLSPEGIPSLDPTDQAKQLLQSLSGK